MAGLAIPALPRERIHKGPGSCNVGKGASKGWTFRKRCRTQLKCKNGIKDM
jgi:hypothetical protein